MKKSKLSRQTVADLAEAIVSAARKAHADGPSSSLYGNRAQMASTLTQAGAWLAGQSRTTQSTTINVEQSLESSAAHHKVKTRRRFWFFSGSREREMPDAKRIDQLLRASAKNAPRLILDSKNLPSPVDLDCSLADGASDPVCRPRS